ncbi:hypothetical protein [Kitasatospora sp. NPDC088548]|uniref:hypothetical protein n=1 Tax=Kitasatospora sp. NPDC088548 TaxID=3364075 RepID=UPI0037FD7661
MNESAIRSAPSSAPARGNWWKGPLISTLATGLCLPLVTALRGLAEMSTDPCYGPGACPSTMTHLAVADYALLAAPVLILLQWPASYLLRQGRALVSLAPAAALLVVLGAVFSINPGA